MSPDRRLSLSMKIHGASSPYRNRNYKDVKYMRGRHIPNTYLLAALTSTALALLTRTRPPRPLPFLPVGHLYIDIYAASAHDLASCS